MAQILHENDNFFRRRFIVRKRPGHALTYSTLPASHSVFSPIVSSNLKQERKKSPRGHSFCDFSLYKARQSTTQENTGDCSQISQIQIVSMRKFHSWTQFLMEIISIIMIIIINAVGRVCVHETCCTHVLSEIKDYCQRFKSRGK